MNRVTNDTKPGGTVKNASAGTTRSIKGPAIPSSSSAKITKGLTTVNC